MSRLMRAAYQLCRLYWGVTRPVSLGAVAVVVDAESRVLMVRHSYQPGWLLPGGGVKRGESSREALARELREELQIECLPEELELVKVYYQRVNFKHDHQVVYLVRSWKQLPRRKYWEIEESCFFEVERLPEGLRQCVREKIADACKIYGSSRFLVGNNQL